MKVIEMMMPNGVNWFEKLVRKTNIVDGQPATTVFIKWTPYFKNAKRFELSKEKRLEESTQAEFTEVAFVLSSNKDTAKIVDADSAQWKKTGYPVEHEGYIYLARSVRVCDLEKGHTFMDSSLDGIYEVRHRDNGLIKASLIFGGDRKIKYSTRNKAWVARIFITEKVKADV